MRKIWIGLILAAISTSCLGETIVVAVRSRTAIDGTVGDERVVLRRQQWDTSKTAIIICDMWDKHWCKGASRRVAEMAPVMNKVVGIARGRGVFVIHAPSSTMDYYKDHPGRKLAKDAPKAANLPEGIGRWLNWIDEAEEKAGYPIDHSQGGCDCEPKCKQYSAWKSQVASIDIVDGDAISDSGVEIWNLLEARGIENVILMGVHTNMCVLGRPFGLRQLARNGKNAVLMRDMTDTMYDSRAKPFVNHFTGTDLVVEHVERYVCPTVASTMFTGTPESGTAKGGDLDVSSKLFEANPEFRFSEDKRPRAVIISAEREYKAVETMPVLARQLELECGFACQIVQGNAGDDEIDRNWIAGMEAIDGADVVIVFARRRAFPAEQMAYLARHIERGGGVVGIRTASHAFDTKGDVPAGHASWSGFDADVLGGNYHGHYSSGPKVKVTAVEGAGDHAILKGVKLPLESVGVLYKTSPLADSATCLLTGRIAGQDAEPIAWTNRCGDSRVFYTSLGHVNDFKDEGFRRMLVNAIFWAAGR